MELTINGQVYSFKFNFGFLQALNKTVMIPVDGIKGVTKPGGLGLAIASLYSGDVEELVNVLDFANKGQDLRITREVLIAYIDDPDTNIDELFDMVLDFLARSNATKKLTLQVKEAVEREQTL